MIEKESDLYYPTESYFKKLGYAVNGEVRGCDLAAVADDRLIICELKKSFTLKLVYQLLERKKLTPLVYAVIPRPKSFRAKNTKAMINLLKKIEAGLICISPETMLADVVLEPKESGGAVSARAKNIKRRINNEVKERVTATVGGVNKTPIMTLYKESSIAALCYIRQNNVLKTRFVKKEIVNAVRSNFYGWFERTGRGEYIMTPKGTDALNDEEYINVINFYGNEVNEKCSK